MNKQAKEVQTDEAKCSCRLCGGHISFAADVAGQTVACPHCGRQTVLRKSKSPLVPALVVAAIALSAIVFVLCWAFVAHGLGLKPADGAFGYNLGETLPTELASKIRYPSEFWPTYTFKPKTEIPPFNTVTLNLLEDGRIYEIAALGYPHESPAECENRLVSVLTEKYGLREHQHLLSQEVGVADTDVYYFGTEERSVRLRACGLEFELNYLDKELQRVASDERKAKRDKRNAPKRSALEKGL